MKTLLTLSLVLAGASTVSAQVYRPSVVGQTTVLGAVAGALIGGHNHDRWAQGAIIGAAAGAVVGAVVDDQRASQRVVYAQSQFGAAPTVGYAPVIGSSAPEVIYVNSAPARVVYVQSCPPPVVVARPVVYVSGGWGYRGHYSRGHDRYDRRHHDRGRW